MIAIDNQELKNYCRNCNCAGFDADLSYVFDASAKTVKVTDASTITSPDSLSIIHVLVHDKSGEDVYGKIESAAGNVTIDVSSLDLSAPLSITATVVTKGGCVSDGSAKNISASGSLGHWDKQWNASARISSITPEPEPDPVEPSGVDKSALQTAIDDVVALDEADYSSETWTALEAKLTAAIDVLGDADATQDEVDTALSELNTAKDALQPAA